MGRTVLKKGKPRDQLLRDPDVRGRAFLVRSSPAQRGTGTRPTMSLITASASSELGM